MARSSHCDQCPIEYQRSYSTWQHNRLTMSENDGADRAENDKSRSQKAEKHDPLEANAVHAAVPFLINNA
jgi:hypothetical protein